MGKVPLFKPDNKNTIVLQGVPKNFRILYMGIEVIKLIRECRPHWFVNDIPLKNIVLLDQHVV